jgi:hypothetical protein
MPTFGARPVLPVTVTEQRTPLSIGDSFALIVPVLQFLQFHSIGVLFASDLLLLAALPLVLARSLQRLRQKQIAMALMLGFTWLIAQVVTDVFRGSQPEDYLRGWSKIALTVTHLAVIWALLRGSLRRFVLYGVGVCIGGTLTCLISPSEYMLADPWKFGLALPVTFAVILTASGLSKGRRKSLILFALVAMSGVNLFMNFRSLGLICLVAAGYSYFRISTCGKNSRLGKLQIVILAFGVLLSALAFQAMYEHAVGSGWLGSAAQEKYESQETGSGGVLLGGRSEILSSGQAIIDAPVLGHGSWARDPKYAAIMREQKAELGYKSVHDKEDDLIPTHSHIFGAWVEAGIVGAFFWFWILKLAMSTLLRATGAEPMLPVFAFIAFLLCWDIVFSPYGAGDRFLATYFIAGIVLLRSLTNKIKFARAGVLNC